MKESELIFGLLRSIGKPEYSFNDIAWLTAPFSVTETCLRNNLSRMVTGGNLQVRKEGKKAFYSFTSHADRMGANVSLAFREPDWSGWNGRWWGVSLSLPDTAKKDRYRYTRKLMHYRFAALHPGFWIRPLREAEKIDLYLREMFQSRYTKVLQFQFYDEKELQSIPELWNITKLNKRFGDCLEYLKKCRGDYDLKVPEDALRAKMILGDIMVRELVSDPLLPDSFLPSVWKGRELRKFFLSWVKLTTGKSKPYWGKILTDTKAVVNPTSNYHGQYY